MGRRLRRNEQSKRRSVNRGAMGNIVKDSRLSPRLNSYPREGEEQSKYSGQADTGDCNRSFADHFDSLQFRRSCRQTISAFLGHSPVRRRRRSVCAYICMRRHSYPPNSGLNAASSPSFNDGRLTSPKEPDHQIIWLAADGGSSGSKSQAIDTPPPLRQNFGPDGRDASIFSVLRMVLEQASKE